MTMMLPIMMIGVVASAVKPAEGKEEIAVATEERKKLPPGRGE